CGTEGNEARATATEPERLPPVSVTYGQHRASHPQQAENDELTCSEQQVWPGEQSKVPSGRDAGDGDRDGDGCAEPEQIPAYQRCELRLPHPDVELTPARNRLNEAAAHDQAQHQDDTE